MIALAQLNALAPDGFVAALAGIFEHSPWVAQRVAGERPFGSVVELTQRMRCAVLAATPAAQLALIRAHPKLGARGPQLTTLTHASQAEQRRAGLAACSDAEYAELLVLNDSYLARFHFPFILAVRGHGPASIIAACRSRLRHTAEEERQAALTQIGLIAGFRLADTVQSVPAAEVPAMQAALQAASDAAAGASGVAALLREWLLGAHLDVHSGEDGRPVGTLTGTDTAAAPLCLGTINEVLLAIGVARELRNRAAVATRALVLDPLAGQPVPGVGPSGAPEEQVKYLYSLVTSSGKP
jgi:OHCU decarboxylase